MSDYWDCSMSELEEIVLREPQNIMALYNLGGKYVMESKWQEAKTVFARVREERPDNSRVYIDLAHAYFQLDQYDDAMELIRKAVELDPTDNEAWTDLGAYLCMDWELREAEECIRRALSLDVNEHNSWFWLGETLRKTDRLDEACEAYTRSILLNSKHDGSWQGLGKCLYALDRLKEAENVLEKASELDPSSSGTILCQVYTKTELEKWQDVVEVGTRALSMDIEKHSESHVHASLGRALLELGSEQEAEVHLCKSIDLYEHNHESRRALGEVYRRTGRYEQAEQALSDAISLRPYEREYHEKLESLLLEMGSEEKARSQREVITDLFEPEWFEEPFTIPYHELDTTIRDHIRALNVLGLRTWGCCSGLTDDHDKDETGTPYVAFRTGNPKTIHWLFTIAAMAGWNSEYGTDGSGVELKLDGVEQDEVRIRWDLLVDSARFVMDRITILGVGG